MKKLSLILLLLLIVIPNIAADVSKDISVKENFSNLLKKTARMIGTLDIKKSGTPAFSKQKKRIIRHLKRVVSKSNCEDQKKYLKNVIKHFRENNYRSGFDCPFSTKTKADMILNFNEKSRNFSPVVLKTSVIGTLSICKLFDKIKIEIGKGILNRNVEFFPVSSVVKISEVIFPANFKSRSIILSLNNKKNDIFPGIILIKNNVEKYFNDSLKPLAQKLFRQKIASGLDPEILIHNMFLHHIAHFTIPFQIEVKDKKSGVKGLGLKELFLYVEEIRADLNYLSIVAEMDKREILDKGAKEKIFYTFLLQKVYKTLTPYGKDLGSPSSVLFNLLFKRGGIRMEKGRMKMVIDMDLLIRNIKALEAKFNSFLIKGKYNECKAFLLQYKKMPDNVKDFFMKIKLWESE